MTNLLIKLLITAMAIFAGAYLLPGIALAGFGTALIVALLLGVVNVLIKPVLIVLTLPINILTLGLFTLVINTLLIMLVASVVSGFKVENFWWALLFGIVVSIIVNILEKVFIK